MSWKLSGSSNVDVEVDTYFKAMRVSLRPVEVKSWQSYGLQTGLVSGLAANVSIFSLRQIASKLLMVTRVGVGFIATTGFTAAQSIAYSLTVARGFTASDTAGTSVSILGNNGKYRVSLDTPTSVDCRITATGALGVGTKTLDANPICITAGYAPASSAGVVIPVSLDNLLDIKPNGYPLILGQNEGINIQNNILMGAGGTGNIYVNIEIAEFDAY